MSILRRAAIWTVAIELPLATLALLSTIPPLYRTVPLVLTAHLPGIALLDGLDMCCGLGGDRIVSSVSPGFVPPVFLSIAILAIANATVIFLCAWLVLIGRDWLGGRRAPGTLRNPGN